MESPQPLFEFIYNYIDKAQFRKYFRLTIVVCVYLFFRTYYSRWSKQNEIKKKIAQDNKEAAEEKENKHKKEAEKFEKFEKLDNEAQTFGWGKATRRKTKRQEAIVKEIRALEQSVYDAQEDQDIEDLLED